MNETTARTPIRQMPQHLPALGGSSGSGGFGIPEEDEIELREYWRVLWKYRLLIAALTVIGALLALVYAFTVTPRYTAETTMRISTYEPVLSATKIEDVLQEKSRETNYLETQIQEIRSFSLADKVLSDPKVKQGKSGGSGRGQGFFSRMFYGDQPESVIDASVDSETGYSNSIQDIKDYLDGLQVRPIRRTSLVIIGALSEDPAYAALVANKHALAYIDWVREKRIEQQSRGLKFLSAQSEELREKVADIERELAEYAESNSIIALNKDENITVQRMSQLNNLLTEATAKRIEYENTYNEALASLNQNSAGYDDSSTQTIRSELAKVEAEYQQLSAKFTDSYPRMQQLKSQIRQMKESIAGQRTQIVNGLKSKFLAAQEEEKKMGDELEQQKSQAFELSKRQVQYNVLNRDLTTSRELLQAVLKQIKETSLAVESNATNVTIVDYAAVPRQPTFPQKKLMLLIGLLSGVGVGVAFAFLLSYLDNTVRTPEDVARTLNLPALGVVPSFGLEEVMLPEPAVTAGNPDGSGDTPPWSPAEAGLPAASSTHMPIMYLSNPRSLASEAYRTIRTGILLSQAGEPPRTILVSSAQSSEGKTTSSINLAASLASAGGRVVLIDADLRRPSVSKQLELNENSPGLVEVLTGLAALEDVLVVDRMPGVTVISSGRIPPNPAELLGSAEMVMVLDRLAASFDYVLIDSPPVLPVTDSVILSRYVDGVVLVVKGASTPRKVARDAKERLRAVGARVLGVILNDVDVRGGDYYYYNRYYHSYYREDATRNANRAATGS